MQNPGVSKITKCKQNILGPFKSTSPNLDSSNTAVDFYWSHNPATVTTYSIHEQITWKVNLFQGETCVMGSMIKINDGEQWDLLKTIQPHVALQVVE